MSEPNVNEAKEVRYPPDPDPNKPAPAPIVGPAAAQPMQPPAPPGAGVAPTGTFPMGSPGVPPTPTMTPEGTVRVKTPGAQPEPDETAGPTLTRDPSLGVGGAKPPAATDIERVGMRPQDRGTPLEGINDRPPSSLRRAVNEVDPAKSAEVMERLIGTASPIMLVKTSFRGFEPGQQVTADEILKSGADLEFLLGNGAVVPLRVGPVSMMGVPSGAEMHISRVSHEQALTALRSQMDEKHSSELGKARRETDRLNSERRNIENTVSRLSEDKEELQKENARLSNELAETKRKLDDAQGRLAEHDAGHEQARQAALSLGDTEVPQPKPSPPPAGGNPEPRSGLRLPPDQPKPRRTNPE